MAVELDVYNPNSFPILVQNVTGTFELGNGSSSATVASQRKARFPRRARQCCKSARRDWTNVAALAPFALSPAPVPFTFRGVAAIGGERFNVDVPFTIRASSPGEQVFKRDCAGSAIRVGPCLGLAAAVTAHSAAALCGWQRVTFYILREKFRALDGAWR